MHPRTRRRTRTLAAATVLALLAVPSAAVAAPEPSPRPVGSSDPQRAPRLVDPADKFTAGANRAFASASDETTDFWLRFAEKPDLSAAEGITSWSERGDYVYKTLLAAAETSQKDAVAELEAAGTKYTSHWATNAILVEDGSLDLATDLAADMQVLEVRPRTHYAAPEPVETTDAPNEAAAAAAGPTWGISAINADDLWRKGFTGEGVVVANIDTGVDGSHPALSGQYRGAGAADPDAFNYFSVDGRLDPHDVDGHGTHTMGTMVGGTVQDEGGVDRAVGVAPDAEWIAAAGGGGAWTDEDLIGSGEWILAPYDQGSANPVPDTTKRPHVVNNSWGSTVASTDPFMEDIAAAWEAAGIFATFANGNLGWQGCLSSGSPGSRQNSYSVGAFAQSGAIADFSSRGPGQSDTVKPDIAAPGVYILSTVPDDGSGRPGSDSDPLGGTSMAAPHVAGAVALLWDAEPELVGNVQATRAILDGTAHDVNDTSCGGTADDNNVWGEGKLDVLAAYELAQESTFTTTVPTISGEYRVGAPLTASVAPWSPVAAFTYQWRRDGDMIGGATKSTYTPDDADLGAELSVTVTGSAAGQTPTSTTSAETPEITDRHLGGVDPEDRRHRPRGFDPAGARRLVDAWYPVHLPVVRRRRRHQWRDRVRLHANRRAARQGAHGPDLRFPRRVHRGQPAQRGHVRRRRGGHLSGAAGDRRPGCARCHADRLPACGRSLGRLRLLPVAARRAFHQGRDAERADHAVRVEGPRHHGQRDRGEVRVRRKTVTSAGATVGGAYTRSPNPTISGTTRVGSTLKVARGTWSPTPSSFSFQWYADGQRISGATGSSYTLKGTEYNKKITVSARSYRAGYGTVLRRSSATGAVLASAVRWAGDDVYSWLVGPDSVPATTYIVQAGSAECEWGRLSSTNKVLAYDLGSGQRLFRVLSTDYAVFASENCGTWIKYYSGMVRTSASTAANGVYALGDHLERGVYSTTGPTDAATSCRYTFYKGFEGAEGVLSRGEVSSAHTITMPSSAAGFGTAGCSWKRIS